MSYTMSASDNQANVSSISVNQSEAIPLLAWGNLFNAITQVYIRAGAGGTLFFIDEIKVTGTLQPFMCPWNPDPPSDLGGDEILYSAGFEGDNGGEAPGAPDIGTETQGNGTVVSGQYSKDGLVGPAVGNSGRNYLALESGQDLKAVFRP